MLWRFASVILNCPRSGGSDPVCCCSADLLGRSFTAQDRDSERTGIIRSTDLRDISHRYPLRLPVLGIGLCASKPGHCLANFWTLVYFLVCLGSRAEIFRWRSLIGALIAITGILIGLGAEIGSTVSLLPLVAIVMAVAVSAEGTVLYKSYPSGDPLVVNSLALSTGAGILILLSIFSRETWILLPASQATWIAYGYLVLAGSVLMFYSFLYVLDRWTASATSYSTLLIPVATIIVAAWLLDEQVTLRFLFGSVIVVIGVWLRAISQPKIGPSN